MNQNITGKYIVSASDKKSSTREKIVEKRKEKSQELLSTKFSE